MRYRYPISKPLSSPLLPDHTCDLHVSSSYCTNCRISGITLSSQDRALISRVLMSACNSSFPSSSLWYGRIKFAALPSSLNMSLSFAHQGNRWKIIPPASPTERTFGAWIGGSIVASLVSPPAPPVKWQLADHRRDLSIDLFAFNRARSNKCGFLERNMMKRARAVSFASAHEFLLVFVLFWVGR